MPDVLPQLPVSSGSPLSLGATLDRAKTFRIATIGAMCVGLDELPDSEAIGGFAGEEGNVFAHELVSVF